ncbi:MAG: diguanylate cyclase [Bacillota bacterium]|nr:diguanylate cyclase [Bacillota bacterium]
MIENYIAIGILNILVLVMLSFMVQKNDILDVKKKKVYSVTIFATVAVILSEVGTSLFEALGPSFRIPNMTANVIGFSVSPIIPILLASVFSNKYSKIPPLLFLPSIANLILTVTSPKCGLIFTISPENVYSRGPAFIFYIVAYGWGIAVLFDTIIRTTKRYYSKSSFILTFLFLFLLIGTTIQVLIPKLHATWTCVTFAMVIYYAFICEFSDKHDILTMLFNRRAYESAKNHFEALERAAVILIDVDNFKQINDTYGHQYGDDCLGTIGIAIKSAFSDIGTGFRIGGDEFCILSDITDEELIKHALERLIGEINANRDKSPQFPTVSIGYKIYHKASGNSINQVFQEADKELYLQKRRNMTVQL